MVKSDLHDVPSSARQLPDLVRYANLPSPVQSHAQRYWAVSAGVVFVLALLQVGFEHLLTTSGESCFQQGVPVDPDRTTSVKHAFDFHLGNAVAGIDLQVSVQLVRANR